MTRLNEGNSYYRASSPAYPGHEQLHGEISCDVCIVGAGFTGLSAALELADAGYDVVVLEAETVGWGASGRNGGQICSGFADMGKIAAQAGADDAQKCFDIAMEGIELIEERTKKYKIDCDLTWGYLHVAAKATKVDEFKGWQEELADAGYTDTEILSKDELAGRVGSPRYHGALREGRSGHFHPLKYCFGLAEAVSRAGVRIYEHSPVVEADTGPAPFAKTKNGKVIAKHIIFAGNAYLGKLAKPLFYRIMPVGSFIIATEALGENRARGLIAQNEAVADTNFVLDYFRLSADHRMLFGGRCTYSGNIPENLSDLMRPRMVRAFPQLEDAKVEHAWGGYIAITQNRIPDIGQLSPTSWYAHGFSGHGVVLSNMCGKLIAEGIRGQMERFDVVSQFKHPTFPGGPVRMPMLVLAMAYYRLKDALG
ncbi:MAG: NAD(P)/FAD-dependent oxidoreductase [Hyphomicrobiales bacterium]